MSENLRRGEGFFYYHSGFKASSEFEIYLLKVFLPNDVIVMVCFSFPPPNLLGLTPASEELQKMAAEQDGDEDSDEHYESLDDQEDDKNKDGQ